MINCNYFVTKAIEQNINDTPPVFFSNKASIDT